MILKCTHFSYDRSTCWVQHFEVPITEDEEDDIWHMNELVPTLQVCEVEYPLKGGDILDIIDVLNRLSEKVDDLKLAEYMRKMPEGLTIQEIERSILRSEDETL